MFTCDVRVRGGDSLKQYLRRIRSAEVDRVMIGFFGDTQTARGALPADLHAKLVEFGTRGRRERAFFRSALTTMRNRVAYFLRDEWRRANRAGKPFNITKAVAREVGSIALEVLVESMNTHRVKDTGLLSSSARFEFE